MFNFSNKSANSTNRPKLPCAQDILASLDKSSNNVNQGLNFNVHGTVNQTQTMTLQSPQSIIVEIEEPVKGKQDILALFSQYQDASSSDKDENSSDSGLEFIQTKKRKLSSGEEKELLQITKVQAAQKEQTSSSQCSNTTPLQQTPKTKKRFLAEITGEAVQIPTKSRLSRVIDDPIHGDSGGTNSLANGSESEMDLVDKEDKEQSDDEEQGESEESYDSEEERQNVQKEIINLLIENAKAGQAPLHKQAILQHKNMKDEQSESINAAIEVLVEQGKLQVKEVTRDSRVYFVPLRVHLLEGKLPVQYQQKMKESINTVNENVETILHDQLDLIKGQQQFLIDQNSQIERLKSGTELGDSPMKSTEDLEYIKAQYKDENMPAEWRLICLQKYIKFMQQSETTDLIISKLSQGEMQLKDLSDHLSKLTLDNPSYLGQKGFVESKMLQNQLDKQRTVYALRKRGCLDMIEVFSELMDCSSEVLKERVGIDSEDFDDQEIQDLLDVPNEVKKGLYGSEDDEDSSENEDN